MDASKPATLREACGNHAGFLSSRSTKDARIRASQNPRRIRVRNRVGITGGYVEGSRAEFSRTQRPAVERRSRKFKRSPSPFAAVTLSSGRSL